MKARKPCEKCKGRGLVYCREGDGWGGSQYTDYQCSDCRGKGVRPIMIMVTGARDWTDEDTIWTALDDVESKYPSSCFILIHGDCRGADAIAATHAKESQWDIKAFPADWEELGLKAGPIRNQKMVDEQPDIVLAFVGKTSKGTYDAIRRAKKANIPTKIYKEQE